MLLSMHLKTGQCDLTPVITGQCQHPRPPQITALYCLINCVLSESQTDRLQQWMQPAERGWPEGKRERLGSNRRLYLCCPGNSNLTDTALSWGDRNGTVCFSEPFQHPKTFTAVPQLLPTPCPPSSTAGKGPNLSQCSTASHGAP